jgi:integrase
MRKSNNRLNLTPRTLRRIKPTTKRQIFWDTTANLALTVEPSGTSSWYFVYSRHGHPRWYRIGPVHAIGTDAARKRARQLIGQVASGHDPQAEKQATINADTFAHVAQRYVDEHASKHNKSYKQAQKLIARYVLPTLGKMKAQAISRANVKELIGGLHATPVLANQVLAALSAVFTWAEREDITSNHPCRSVTRHATTSRSRILSDSEVPKFWREFDEAGLKGAALKVLLLTGQRPGEILHMRREHIVDGWWQMPGQPVPELQWPGVKNKQDHRVFLVEEVRELIGDGNSGFVFGSMRLEQAMRDICQSLGVERCTPHDLRRSMGSAITSLGFGRQAMDRILNHSDNSVGSIYDRYSYAKEDQQIMQAVARRVMNLVAGDKSDNVRQLRRVKLT